MTRSDIQPKLQRITLAFVDPREETRYVDYNFATAMVPMRWATLSGLVVLLMFGYMDYLMFPLHYRRIWIGRGLCALYIILSFLLTYTSYYRRAMQPVTALGPVLCAVLAVWMMRVTTGQQFCGELYVGILICVIFSCMFLRLSFPWVAASSLAMLGMFLGFTRGCFGCPDDFAIDAVYLSLGTVSAILGAYSIEFHLRKSYWQAWQLDQARQQHQELLHSILPPSIAIRLNRGETIIADNKVASVLFADIVDSVKWATTLGSARFFELLNEIFSEFDRLIERHGLETIKTTGDGYMVAGNCSKPLDGHVHAITGLALAMRTAIAGHRWPNGQPISLRIGIHTGPVIAGVMRLSKPSYDVWGDTVNIASRMQSHAEPGAIQITEDVLAAIHGDYEFEGPFPIEVKGKGTMQVYRLLDVPRSAGPYRR
jgi:class 3 adenylate cyclase